MREKLLVLMKNEGLTSSRLAELLGIQPSGISHILAGRNKPSFDFVQKVLRRFPRINPDWLLLDSEQMYRDLPEENSQPSENALFPDTNEVNPNEQQNREQQTTSQVTATSVGSPSSWAVPNLSNAKSDNRAIKRIIVLYHDHTFESYDPER